MENIKNDNPKNSRDYKENIIAMVNKIEDTWILKQIYRCIINISKGG